MVHGGATSVHPLFSVFSLCEFIFADFSQYLCPVGFSIGQHSLHSLGTLAAQRLHNLICCDRLKRPTPASFVEPASFDELAKERTEHA